MTPETQAPQDEPATFGGMLETMSDDTIVKSTGLQPATVAVSRERFIDPQTGKLRSAEELGTMTAAVAVDPQSDINMR